MNYFRFQCCPFQLMLCWCTEVKNTIFDTKFRLIEDTAWNGIVEYKHLYDIHLLCTIIYTYTSWFSARVQLQHFLYQSHIPHMWCPRLSPILFDMPLQIRSRWHYASYFEKVNQPNPHSNPALVSRYTARSHLIPTLSQGTCQQCKEVHSTNQQHLNTN